MLPINFIVDRFNVSVSNRTIIKDIRDRIREHKLIISKQDRKYLYKAAIERHENNKDIYNFVTKGE